MVVNIRQIMDEKKVVATIATMTEKVISGYQNELQDLVFVGVIRRGMPIAEMAVRIVRERTGINIPVVPLNITLYKDDLSYVSRDEQPVVQTNFASSQRELQGKIIIVWDDVAYTLTTFATAYQVLKKCQPAKVDFAALVDRIGWHKAGYESYAPRIVGLSQPTSAAEIIKVKIQEIDGETSVWLQEKKGGKANE